MKKFKKSLKKTCLSLGIISLAPHLDVGGCSQLLLLQLKSCQEDE